MKKTEKLMKSVKRMLLLAAVVFFTSVPFAVEARDCSDLKKLHKKLMCKAGSDRYDSERSATAVIADKVEKEKGEPFNEKYDSIADIFKKITRN